MLDDVVSYFKKLIYGHFNRENEGKNYNFEEVNRELRRGFKV